MKINIEWLREWVNPELSVEAIAEQFSLAGLEVESISPVSGQFSHVIIGCVVSVTPHPNATRLQWCQVDIGSSKILNIVCGAKNLRVGLKVAVARVGAHLPDNRLIEEAEIRGVISQGMLCSRSELGLIQNFLDQGILELPEDAPISSNLWEYLHCDDSIIDMRITPNRGDCLSAKGLARDLAAITGKMLNSSFDISSGTSLFSRVSPVLIPDKYDVKIDSTEDCPNYCGRIIRGISQKAKTPLWLSERLLRCGIRCIHPVVDITNYVMLELGQPLHSFDCNRLDTELQVRRAYPNEKLRLLDGKNVVLNKNTLVIADKTQAQAIAGIIGSSYSAVTEGTQDIFLESAFFSPMSLMGRARQYGLCTEASFRFERGVDPEITVLALERATQLILDIVGGKAGPVVQAKSGVKASLIINFRCTQVKKLLGFSLEEEQILLIFERLGIHVEYKKEGVWGIRPPTWRFDIKTEVDLIEELVRIYGYSFVPSNRPHSTLQFSSCSELVLPLRRLRHLLMDRGYHEVINYSFIAPSLQRLIDPEANILTLCNPISTELSVMRTSLWPGLLQTLLYNQQRQQRHLRFFEIGLCFHLHDGKLEQVEYVGGGLSGNKVSEQWGMLNSPMDFFTVKSDIEALFQLTKQPCIQFKRGAHPALHPGESSQVWQAERTIGHFGAVHPKITTELGLIGPVYLFEIAMASLTEKVFPHFKPFSKFPMVRRDLSFWIDESISAQRVLDKVSEKGGSYLKEAYLFDVYPAKDGSKKRSLAVALLWQHPTSTLVDSEVDDLMLKLSIALKESFEIELRDS